MIDDGPAEEPTDILAKTSEDVVSLARVASLAVVMEPALLRRIRLDVLPSLHVGVEADLWFSPLADIASATVLTLRADCTEVLRGQLARPEHRALAAAGRRIVADAHRVHGDMLRLEEELVWHTIQGDVGAIEQGLQRALATLAAGPDRAAEVVRWFSQARRRIPQAALRSAAGRQMLAAVALHLDRTVPRDLIGAARFPERLAGLGPTGLPTTVVAVELLDGGLRFSAPSAHASAVVEVPVTYPVVVEARWPLDANVGEASRVVVVEQGTTVDLGGLTGEVVLRTLAGRRYRLTAREVKRVTVSVMGPSGASWSAVMDRLDNDLAAEGIDIGWKLEQTSLDARPDFVLVFAMGTDPSDFDGLMTQILALHQAVVRAYGPDGDIALHALLVAEGATGASLAREVRDRVGLTTPVLFSGPEPTPAVLFEVEAALFDRLRRVATSGRPLFELRLESSLILLQSVALAFHVRRFHGEEIGDEEAERQLFDLTDDVSQARYTHVRNMCEYLFTGPVREYLGGGPNPSKPDPALFAKLQDPQTGGYELDRLIQALRTGLTPQAFAEIAGVAADAVDKSSIELEAGALRDRVLDPSYRDTVSAALTPLKMLPMIEGARMSWSSFADYLQWFVSTFRSYAALLADRLESRRVDNGYTVPVEVLEEARSAFGTDALPPGEDEPVRWARDDRPEVRYPIERSRLPDLIDHLAQPILRAVAELESREGQEPVEDPGSDRSDLVMTLQGHTAPVRSVAWSPDGSRIASAGEDGAVHIWDSVSGVLVATLTAGGGVHSVAWLPDSRRIVSGGSDGTVQVWWVASGERMADLSGHRGAINAVTVGRLDSSTVFISAGDDGTVRVWQDNTGELLVVSEGHSGRVESVAFATLSGRPVVASGGRDATVRLWDTLTGEQLGEPLPGQAGWVGSVAFRPRADGRPQLLASAGLDGRVLMWDPEQGSPFGAPFIAHERQINALAWSPDGERIATASDDGSVRVWDPEGYSLASFDGHENWANSVAWAPDGSLLASAGADESVRVWRVEDPQPA